MSKKWDGIRNKSFTLPGVGGELIVSETIDRLAIEVRLVNHGVNFARVQLTAAQFDALCNMNSAYDGLEVRTAPKPPTELPVTENTEEVPAAVAMTSAESDSF